MASLKAEKPTGTQLFGHAKKEPVKATSDGAVKGPASKSAPKKTAQKPQEPKKKLVMVGLVCVGKGR
ncbi:SWI/SNF-related matrix-associated actin-dependent regulator of chromatin subfamily A-like protein 1 [Quillaja saponaria]|uniref:SWI/SNF-related matrix-associated actin-dependent regulator of chromatin subfamily A-like protein 1 n=1 Tax=Quillaja saponaria TaxID=32244 RepID=A0AAD7KPH0_QUISA|nr:SWI/SNF-related matrix-associated actin-dependent regulator of chromatin subfamily A-like protein 1 [Quillaja saponaria]